MRSWALAALAVGCGGKTSEDSFVEDYAEASCDWLKHCSGSFPDDYDSASACVDDFVADVGQLPVDCAFDQGNAQSCIDQIREDDCGNDVFEGGVCYRVCGSDSG